MANSLARLLLRINCDPLILDRRQLTGDCEALWDWCHRHSLLEMTTPKRGSLCPDCWEAVPVVSLPSRHAGEDPAFYVSCEECGPSRIPIAQVCQWVFHVSRFLEAILREVPRAGTTGVIHGNRWWRLGRTRWATGYWNLYFAREVPHKSKLSEMEFPPRSVLLVPTSTLSTEARPAQAPVILPLDQVLVWDGADIRFDQEYVVELLHTVATPPPKPKSSVSKKEKDKNLTIEAIKQELVQHLISARDFALTTQDRTGVPQLLPRPTLAELGQRMGFSESTASRYLKISKGLRELWALADDIDRILAFRLP